MNRFTVGAALAVVDAFSAASVIEQANVASMTLMLLASALTTAPWANRLANHFIQGDESEPST